MLYKSTRGGIDNISSAEAIKRGIAPDGGLFVPSERARISLEDIIKMADMTYPERAVLVLSKFLDDYSEDELEDCVNSAYTYEKFSGEDIVPIIPLTEQMYIMELWHGPTCAFKDMALQILPHFLVKAVGKTGEQSEIVILVATSGDTGKAALEGFSDVEGTRIIVFFPDEGVSEVQKLQMVTQTGNNVSAIAVKGNFDDAQTGVKNIFTDEGMIESLKENGYKFSSANSINWGRLVPQIVYYFSAYADMLRKSAVKPGDKVNFVVPTGNFGNILAAWYAQSMGLPVNKLICASNDNKVLTDFLRTGVYDGNRDFIKTISPSMDILISSNLERLLYELTNHDSDKVGKWMKDLKREGAYEVDSKVKNLISNLFWAGYATQEETLKTIECVYNEYRYLIDTHTAVGIDVYDKYVISTGDLTPTAIASTASPFKFNKSVAGAVLDKDKTDGESELGLLKILSDETGWSIPEGLNGLMEKKVLHSRVCEKDEMKQVVSAILGIIK